MGTFKQSYYQRKGMMLKSLLAFFCAVVVFSSGSFAENVASESISIKVGDDVIGKNMPYYTKSIQKLREQSEKNLKKVDEEIAEIPPVKENNYAKN